LTAGRGGRKALMDSTLTGDELAALEPLAGQVVGGRH
jgi:hypothetical protein